jgi:protein-tyrosine phosphatase
VSAKSRAAAFPSARALVRDLRALQWGARRRLLALRIQRWRGIRSDTLPPLPGGRLTALFVCHGNIMRSPMGEVLLRAAAERSGDSDLVVVSAGLRAAPGCPADPRARAAAHQFGVSLDAHRAQPITRELIDAADVVFVMDWRNEAELIDRFPDAADKVVLLGAFGAPDSREAPVILDPYAEQEEGVAACYRRLRLAVDAVAARMVRGESVAAAL